MSNPLPVSLPQECRKAAKLLNAFADPSKGLDSIIPAHVLRKAKGFAFLTVVKAGFVFSARAGSGVVIARLSDGNWSAPSACGTAGGGFGFQAGVEMAEFIIILNSRAAVGTFMAAGSITLGGNMSIAAGPIGRNVEGTGSISTKGKVAAMYSYSRTKGLFGGASIEGSVIVERSDANRQAYGFNATAKQLLSGSVDPPAFADVLIDTIVRKSGGKQEWNPANDEDEDMRDSFGTDPKSYSFGSAFARGGSSSSPSAGMEKSTSSKGISSKLGSYVPGSNSRSRSNSAAAIRAGLDSPSSSMARSQSREGPVSVGTTRFETEFTNEFEHDSLADDGTGEHWRGSVNNKKSPATKLTKSSSASRFPRNDSPSRPAWDAEAGPTRDSFEFLDDDKAKRNGFRGEYDNDYDEDDYGSRGGRYRASTVGSSSRPVGLLAKARSASNPWSSKNKKAAAARSSSPYINADPSPFDDEIAAVDRPFSTRARSGSSGPKPWDSEEEEFFTEERPSTTLRSSSRGRSDGERNVITTPRGERKDPFDFSQVEADFASNIASHHPGLARGTGGSGTSTPQDRSRSGTVGGIGKAIALYDFAGVENTDLPFKKGDIITILSRDDEQWWRGRLKLAEGLFPQNYVEAHFD